MSPLEPPCGVWQEVGPAQGSNQKSKWPQSWFQTKEVHMVFGGNMAPDFNTVSYRRRATNEDMAAAHDILAAGGSRGLSQQAVPRSLSS